MNPNYNPLYLTTNGDTKIPLAQQLKLYGYVCAVTDMKGEFELLYPEEHVDDDFFLCCDFVHESILDSITLPALHRIPLKNVMSPNGRRKTKRVNVAFSTKMWVGCNRDEVSEIRLYISTSKGHVPSFRKCELKCSLICIPRHFL